jgi:hypothetical protein
VTAVDVAEIAEQLQTLNADAADLVVRLDDEQWRRVTAAEGWPIAVTARHIALGHQQFVTWIRRMTAGEQVDPGDVDAVNAQRAAAGVVADQSEVARALEETGALAVQVLAGLGPADVTGDLDFGGRVLPRVALLGASVRHVAVHLASIRATLEAT